MAKYCCVCKRKLGMLNTGFELGGTSSGYLLCNACNFVRLDLRTIKSEEEYEKKIRHFAKLLNDPSTPASVSKSIMQYGNQGLRNLELAEKAKRWLDEQKRSKFNGDLPVYEFHVAIPFTIASAYSYEMNISVFKDRVHVERVGQTLGLPKEMEISFIEIASITWGEAGRLGWIKFVMPGITGSKTSMPTAVLKNGLILNEVELVPYNDAYSLIIDTVKDASAKKHYTIIKKCYDEYKVSHTIS